MFPVKATELVIGYTHKLRGLPLVSPGLEKGPFDEAFFELALDPFKAVSSDKTTS